MDQPNINLISADQKRNNMRYCFNNFRCNIIDHFHSFSNFWRRSKDAGLLWSRTTNIIVGPF